ncbi:ABC transporter permease [Clostridium felsineum]|uniref:Uncharacterized protein n=1 Tax=Clostridium felsineum TaxID=36839 RepID=A0A1S8LPC0_9CLOT|nr:ABC transporter permease [Clostridium felsineum]MCR3759984.1 ABC transporter permease [Clostridium felsineum]URZ05659.1 hypothetical protein CLROS_009850 [Clostridium felsineum]URZ10698.1 hypothetical protein CROST_014080 [Clostridium felsineum]
MYNLLKVEFYKLKHSKFFYILIGLMFLQSLCVLIPLKANYLLKKTGESMFLQAFPLQEFLINTLLIGAFSYFVTKEFQSGYVKNLIASGHRRINIVLSKAIVFCIGVAVISFIFPICTLVINTITNGYGGEYSLVYIFKLSIVMIIMYFAMGSIGILFSFVTKNVGAVIVIFYLMDIANRFGTAMSLNNDTVKYYYSKTIFDIPGRFADGKLSSGTIFELIFICLVTLIVCVTLSTLALRKVDIK